MSVAVEFPGPRLKMRGSKKAADRSNTADTPATGRTMTGEVARRAVRSPGRLTCSDDLALPPELVDQLARALARVLVESVRRGAERA